MSKKSKIIEKMFPDEIIDSISLSKRKNATFIWPQEDWEYLKKFAEANGFKNLLNGFRYLGAYHWTENRV